MSGPVLKIAVVGHTNTGKTSLLRTLTREVNFGEVSDRPATTRHVEGVSLTVAGQPLIELYDTPGLEDSISLLDHLESMGADRRVEGMDLIRRFLESDQAHAGGRFAQEAKALRQVLAGDAALYVVDSRDPVLGKHRDELLILSWCARPIVPVLNFVADAQAQTSLWREHLSRVNLHAVAEFDTVVFDARDEQRLFEKMQSLLDRHRATINALMADRRQQRERLIAASASLVADMLIDVAAHAIDVPVHDQAETAKSIERLKQQVRDREQKCVEQLLELHRFRIEDFRPQDVQLTNGQWGIDLFSPAALKQFGIRSGGGAAAGAMAGLAVDAMLHGISLGAATAIGAAIGAFLGTGHLHGKRLINRTRGRTELRCDDATLKLLLARQASLITALLRRGHASLFPIEIDSTAAATKSSSFEHQASSRRKLPPDIDEARTHPRWSHLAGDSFSNVMADNARVAAVNRLALSIKQDDLFAVDH